MADLLVLLGVAALAGGQITETLRHGSIFRPLRLWAYRAASSRYFFLRLPGELISCPFCLSHWACGIATVWLLAAPADSILAWPMHAFAVVRLAQLLNDSTHSFARSPETDDEDDYESATG